MYACPDCMHILIVPAWFETPDRPTAGKAVKDLAYALALEGIKVNILFQSRTRLPYPVLLQYQIEVWHAHSSIPGKIYPVWNWISLWSFDHVFKQYLNKHGLPDIIHVHSYSMLAIARYLSDKYQIRIVYTEHSSKVAQSKLNAIEKKLLSFYLDQRIKIIAVSEFLKSGLQKLIPGFKIQVIPNTIDFSYFIPGQRSRTSQFIMINLLNQNKQVDLGIRSFAHWSKKSPEASLHIIGDGPEKQSLKRLAETLAIQNQIVWWGEKQIENWLPILQSSSGLLFLSKFESFGVVALEAIACGVPLIVIQNQGINDIIDKNQIPILRANANETAIAAAMNDVLENYSKSAAIDLRNQLQTRFDYPVVARQYIEVYKSCLNNNQ